MCSRLSRKSLSERYVGLIICDIVRAVQNDGHVIFSKVKECIKDYHVFFLHFSDLEINECLSNPCVNGAACLNEINQFLCVCVEGFTGVYCETSKLHSTF